MATIVYTSPCLSWKNNRQTCASGKWRFRTRASACSTEGTNSGEESKKKSGMVNRRSAMISGASMVLGFPGEGLAVVKQGLLAGRVPGLSEPDEQG